MTRPALRLDAVLVQAVIAGALSFAHLHDLAAAAGQTGWKAWAYPVSVDLLLVAAWHRLRNGGSKPAAWCWFAVALTASLGANVATAGLLSLNGVPAWLRILVAGWPAVAFLGGTLLAHGSRTQTPEPSPEPVPADIDDPDASDDSTAELPPAPVPASAPGSASSPVPPALVALARKVADEHRARTGTAIDTTTLRSRLGVPLPLAEAITTHHLT
ncbi:DUF2637 domain-containing protein [Streptomyces sp. NPDC058294]|uniref:DUF2637 domain-containing protein n=1 Tax=Streptomyces sp. NPDC058294 TaxID=3346430 RepID=UPI0036EA30EE